jgi:hypothetical protein
MFVESMSFEEIRKEFDRDKPSMVRKMVHHSDSVMKQMRKTNMTHFEKYYDWISPRKNRWTYRFELNGKVIGSNFFIRMYCQFFTERSYAVLVYSRETDRVIYYTSHFFTRYFQREGLPREDLHEIIKTFLEENNQFITHPLKQIQSDTYDSFIQMRTGAAFGTLHRALNLVELRTFITNDMLKGDQVALSKALEERFQIGVVRKKEAEGK